MAWDDLMVAEPGNLKGSSSLPHVMMGTKAVLGFMPSTHPFFW